jgi:hypothetical protein
MLAQQPARRRREEDLYAWLLEQTDALKRSERLRVNHPGFIDWSGLAEEIEELSIHLEHSLESYLEVLLTHLLKWRYQPKKRNRRWQASRDNSRDHAQELLKRSPSLRTKLLELSEAAYRRARREAGAQMGYEKAEWNKRLPDSCPWSIEDILNDDFIPTPANGSK